MAVISVDLAYVRYSDIGIAALQYQDDKINVRFIRPQSPTGDPPEPKSLSHYLTDLCEQNSAGVLLIDGPQAWKDPNNGLEHSRVCERVLNTPAKTGLPGNVKPRNYQPFVSFSIQLFDCLQEIGWTRLDQKSIAEPSSRRFALESFPMAAWKSLTILPLPAKKKAHDHDLRDRLYVLKKLYPLVLDRDPNHDEIQALVAGLAGIAFEANRSDYYDLFGTEPRWISGTCREGFILLPRHPGENRSSLF